MTDKARASIPLWELIQGAIHPIPRLSKVGIAAVFIAVAAVASIAITYVTLSGATPITINRDVLTTLLIVNLAIVVLLTPIIVWRVIKLWKDRGKQETGSRLHLRMVVLFSVITIIPAIIVAVFSSATLTLSLNSMLDEPVPRAIDNSSRMAQYYLDEQLQRVGAELRAMSNDVNNNAQLYKVSPIRFSQYLEFQINVRGLGSAYLIDSSGQVRAKAEREGAPPYSIPAKKFMTEAEGGKLTIFSDFTNNQLRAMYRLEAFEDGYLVVARLQDPRVLSHMAQMRQFIDEYQTVAQNRNFLELVFALTYIVITLMVLLGAIWLGLRASTNLISPVGRLMSAAEKVSEGDLSARVVVSETDDEIGTLSETFNRMTGQIETQRNDLIDANEKMDQRRKFTEAVLGGVSAGVLGIDAEGKITITNQSALKLLGYERAELVGHEVRELIPEFDDIIKQAQDNKEDFVEDHVHITVKNQPKHFSVQVTGDHTSGKSVGYVITFDDITKLVSAQRTAAWADVARRIAHEIRNPLTPIQLSAERLQRKYSKEVTSDPTVFERCTDTIIRQVKDIGRMVDEFSSFARMPVPVMKEEELVDLLKRSVFSQRVANSGIDYSISVPDEEVLVDCDGRLLGQALTNILKNAAEAIESKATSEESPEAYEGQIDVTLEADDRWITITIEDNGCGLPKEERERLTEPYMTTRAKGTGLGLAIVKKIMEDHGGELILTDSTKLSGAMSRLTLPIKTADEMSSENTTSEDKKMASEYVGG